MEMNNSPNEWPHRVARCKVEKSMCGPILKPGAAARQDHGCRCDCCALPSETSVLEASRVV